MTWRDALGEVPAVPFRKDVLLRLTGTGARLVSQHAKQRGVSREEWIRGAIRMRLEAEGAAHIPELAPYRGERLVRQVGYER